MRLGTGSAGTRGRGPVLILAGQALCAARATGADVPAMGSATQVTVALAGLAVVGNFTYHIHQTAVAGEGYCASASGHWDPFGYARSARTCTRARAQANRRGHELSPSGGSGGARRTERAARDPRTPRAILKRP